LFHELKQKYPKRTQVLCLSSELANVAETYADLDIADSELWRQYSAARQVRIHALSILGSLQIRPILLAALKASGRGDLLAEAYRLQGELLLRQAVPEAALSLSGCGSRASGPRPWSSWRRSTAGPIYGRFAEGFDTANLREAKALLETLS
jgi:hypothetical protein